MVASREAILITGSTGFLGTAMSHYCAGHGLDVIGVDMVVPRDNDVFKYFHQTERLEEDLGVLLEKFRPAFLVHFAGNADVQRSWLNPTHDFQCSVQLFSRVLDSVRQFSADTKVLLASSAAVYGQPGLLPIQESVVPDPISPYGYHKWLCEIMAKEYASIYGLKTASMRIFSAYGAGLKKQLLWDLCCKCRDSGIIELSGDGDESRDFIHAKDVANAALGILRGGAFSGECYNVASGVETTVSTVAHMVLERFGLPAERICFSGESRIGNPRNWRADISRLSASLGFSPAIDFQQGITEYVEWFKRLR